MRTCLPFTTVFRPPMASGPTRDGGLDRHDFVLPEGLRMPAGGLGIRLKDQPMDKERRLRTQKSPAAMAFARANRIDRTMLGSSRPRLGIVCQGQAYKDVIEAFAATGISGAQIGSASCRERVCQYV